MKRTIVAVLALLCAALALTGCGTNNTPSSLDTGSAMTYIEKLGIYPKTTEPDSAQLAEIYGLDTDLIQKQLIGIPLMNVHSSQYFMLLAKNDADAATLQKQMDAYYEKYQASWDTYLPEQGALVRDRSFRTIKTDEGVWLVYVISGDNDAVNKAIDSALVS